MKPLDKLVGRNSDNMGFYTNMVYIRHVELTILTQ